MDQNLILLTKKILGGPKKILKINKYKILNYYYIYIFFFLVRWSWDHPSHKVARPLISFRTCILIFQIELWLLLMSRFTLITNQYCFIETSSTNLPCQLLQLLL